MEIKLMTRIKMPVNTNDTVWVKNDYIIYVCKHFYLISQCLAHFGLFFF